MAVGDTLAFQGTSGSGVNTLHGGHTYSVAFVGSQSTPDDIQLRPGDQGQLRGIDHGAADYL